MSQVYPCNFTFFNGHFRGILFNAASNDTNLENVFALFKLTDSAVTKFQSQSHMQFHWFHEEIIASFNWRKWKDLNCGLNLFAEKGLNVDIEPSYALKPFSLSLATINSSHIWNITSSKLIRVISSQVRWSSTRWFMSR